MNLAEYETRQAALIELARQWSIELDLRTTTQGNSRGAGVPQAHLVCTLDRQSIFTLAPDTRAGAYVFTVAGLESAVVRHFRECHCDAGGVPR
jgi:hypothetical protein